MSSLEIAQGQCWRGRWRLRSAEPPATTPVMTAAMTFVMSLTTGGAMTTRAMTYQELGEHLGIEPASAKRLALRRKWAKTIGNDGRSRVTVPLDELPERAAGDDAGDDAVRLKPHANDAASDDTDVVTATVAVLTNHIKRLEGEIEALKKERAEAQTRAADRDVLSAQVEALRDALDAANRRGDEQKQRADEQKQSAEEWKATCKDATNQLATQAEKLAAARSWWSKLLARTG
jgi:hypothetical protein